MLWKKEFRTYPEGKSFSKPKSSSNGPFCFFLSVQDAPVFSPLETKELGTWTMQWRNNSPGILRQRAWPWKLLQWWSNIWFSFNPFQTFYRDFSTVLYYNLEILSSHFLFWFSPSNVFVCRNFDKQNQYICFENFPSLVFIQRQRGNIFHFGQTVHVNIFLVLLWEGHKRGQITLVQNHPATKNLDYKYLDWTIVLWSFIQQANTDWITASAIGLQNVSPRSPVMNERVRRP